MKRTKRLWHPTYLSTKYKTQRIVDGKIERRQQKISIESTTDTLLQKKNVEKKRRKMNED